MNFLKQVTQIGGWSTPLDIVFVGILAALLTAIEIHFSQQFGLLSAPPIYDGITYMFTAKSLYYQFGQSWFQPPSPLIDLAGNRYPFWIMLMMAGFMVLGEGEWQCYAVRFFPTFLLLLLMLGVIRKRGNRTIAWVCVVFTALLPLISVSLRAARHTYFVGQTPSLFGFGEFHKDALNWYFADLRPNLLFAVLLLWAIVLVIEHVHTLNRNTLLAAGTFGGLALLSKTAFLPIFLFVTGLTTLIVLAYNRKRLFSTALTCLWALPPFILLMLPWALAGGIGPTLGYIYQQAILKKSIWANPNATFVSEASYFWNLFFYQMGIEGCFLLGLGLLSGGIAWIKLKRVDPSALAYLALAIGLYLVIAINPVKDAFTGQLYYLLLWLFAWIALVPILLWLNTNYRMGLLASVSVYCVVIFTSGFYALSQLPQDIKRANQHNRTTIQQIGSDMRQLLTAEDCFVPADITYWTVFEYYTLNGQGTRPKSVMWDSIRPVETIPSFIQKDISACRAVLVHTSDIAEVEKYLHVHPTTFPFFRAVKTWVTQPNSPYKLFKTYQLMVESFPSDSSNLRPLEIQLFFKQKLDLNS